MAKILLLSIIIVGIALALLSVKLILKRDGKFSSMHIHDSEAMKQRGIHCVLDQDREMRSEA
ncbi:MAG: hypothetical protein IKC86_03840 [Prevotella sp.]|nr:hypothetical protein [Prevotella sp.]